MSLPPWAPVSSKNTGCGYNKNLIIPEPPRNALRHLPRTYLPEGPNLSFVGEEQTGVYAKIHNSRLQWLKVHNKQRRRQCNYERVTKRKVGLGLDSHALARASPRARHHDLCSETIAQRTGQPQRVWCCGRALVVPWPFWLLLLHV